MKIYVLVIVLCLAIAAGVSGCGGDDATSSETQPSSSVAAADDSGPETTTDGEGATESELPPNPEPVLGEYEAEGPFAAVIGQEGNKKPLFKPSGKPAPKEVVFRELEVGSGPAAGRGDAASVYFAGAIHKTGEVQLYGWPPSDPSVVELGSGIYGKTWEKSIEGMKVGGIRQVILPSSEFAEGKPVDYVILMTDLEPKKSK
jgi:peptidylprolyl isomerase